MKKILLFASCAMIGLHSSAQTTPTIANGSFEAWVAPSGNLQLERPEMWYCSDELINQLAPMFQLGGIPVTLRKQLYKDSLAYEGNFAARIRTEYWGDSLRFVPAIFTNAKQTVDQAVLLQAAATGNISNINPMDLISFNNGTPMYGNRVDSVSAYVNTTAYLSSVPDIADTAMLFITALKIISSDSVAVIGRGTTLLTTGQSGYQRVSVSMDYQSADEATDSLIVGFISSTNVFDSTISYNYLHVDKVELFSSTVSGIHNIKNENLGFEIYPNPATAFININNTGNVLHPTIVIRNVIGQTMHQQVLQDKQVQINLSQYPNGIYYYDIYNNKGTAKQSGRFIK